MISNLKTSRQLETVLNTENLSVYYGHFLALKGINLEILENQVTVFLGPCGCGKSTLLRCYNRLNDLIANFEIQGRIWFDNEDLYSPMIDPSSLRRRVAMIFEKPNPFPKSIYDNIAFGARMSHYSGNIDELVERSLRQTFLWDEVKDSLLESALILSREQQQRLCISRAIALQPKVLLMDEPFTALDPFSTRKIETLVEELKQEYTIVLATKNIQQAFRIADSIALFNVRITDQGMREGYLVESDRVH